MRRFITLISCCLLMSFSVMGKEKKKKVTFVPLAMKPGLWLHTIDLGQNSMMEAMLKGVSEQEKKQMMKMLKDYSSKIDQATKQCFTAEDIKNPKPPLDVVNKKIEGKDCRTHTIRSRSDLLHLNILCDGVRKSDIKIVVVDEKNVTYDLKVHEGGEVITSKVTGKWLQSKCP